MKLVLTIPNYAPLEYGAEAVLRGIAEHLADKHEVHVITRRLSGQPVEETRDGVRIHRVLPEVNLRTLNRRVNALLFCPFAFLALCRQGKGAVLLSQGFSANLASALCARLHAAKLAIFFQGGDLAEYAEHATPFRDPLMRFIVGGAAQVICASRHVAKQVEAFGPRACTVIPNGVDLGAFAPPAEAVKRESNLLFTASRLTPKNGVDLLLRALPLLPGIQLWIAGEGQERQALEALARELGVAERARFLGYVPHAEIPGYLRRAGAFIRVSRDEGFGLAFLEAMAVGTPVISTGLGGIPEFAAYEKCDLSPEGIAAAVKRVLSDEKRAESLVRDGLEKARRHSLEAVHARIESEIRSLQA